ncbi:MAG: SOS response-associated peptidase [Anaerolineales bacterium]|nr:SOS response-associated peptidase [Anaerolineales bacterium]
MCGRFTLTVDPSQLAAAFDLAAPPPPELVPRYNIAPTQPVAVIANTEPRRIELFRWGLIPMWAKDAKIGHSLINARAETVAEKPAFRAAFKQRRCLVLADGFYEWRREAAGKTPMYIQLKDGRPFALAGLWETWQTPAGETWRTCTVITTTPNRLMTPIHDRMPVILPPAAYAAWLTPGSLPAVEALALLQPYDPEAMTARPVSTRVNNPRVDAPDLLAG